MAAKKEGNAMPKKTSGISAVYSSVTGTVVNTCEVVNILTLAGKQLAMNAESAAKASRINSELELYEALSEIGTEKLVKLKELKELFNDY